MHRNAHLAKHVKPWPGIPGMADDEDPLFREVDAASDAGSDGSGDDNASA